jgi:hypothetical protein
MNETENPPSDPASLNSAEDFTALQSVIGALMPLSPDRRVRILESAATFLAVRQAGGSMLRVEATPTAPQVGRPAFSEDTSPTPKEFLVEKQPQSDVERVACLAYYLTHYRDQPHFKTLDLSKLNTEAAQPKFSNAAYAASNAVKMRYLAPSLKGHRQLSAAGEQFVIALPDRQAAKAAMTSSMPRRRPRKAPGTTSRPRGRAGRAPAAE